MENQIHEMTHPLIKNKISILRDKNTTTKEFREIVGEIGLLMGYEATRNFELYEEEIETPLAKTKAPFVKTKVSIVPILRAGLGMVDAIKSLIPTAKIGHIGLYRDHKTHQPVEYYCKLPTEIHEGVTLVLDPMLATGGSAVAAIDFIKQRGGTNIKFMCIIAAPEGLKVLSEAHPDVEIFVGNVDKELNENCYILPGLGDAGDRIFGTI
ncbi:MAG: uracil phosphoribosyltransferase [Clostridia bacterium]|nr:uracil phosphoribosyltransferase [Clostridia bacterium]